MVWVALFDAGAFTNVPLSCDVSPLFPMATFGDPLITNGSDSAAWRAEFVPVFDWFASCSLPDSDLEQQPPQSLPLPTVCVWPRALDWLFFCVAVFDAGAFTNVKLF